MSKVKDLINQQGDAKLDEVKNILGILYDAAAMKSKLFGEEIERKLRTAGQEENMTVPVSFIVNHFEEIRVVTKSSTDIIKKITESLNDVLSGSTEKIISGISNMVDKVINSLLGSSEGMENEKKCYYVATDGLSIVRLDMCFWCRSISVDVIKNYAEKSLVCTIYKSTIDVEKINFNTFLSVYQEQLKRMDFESIELLDEIKHAKEIYKIMKEPNVNSSNACLGDEVNQSYVIGELESSTKKVTGSWPPIHFKK